MAQRISLEALAALPTVVMLNVSHSGEQVAFYADWTGRFELYTLDLATRERRQVTDGQAPKAIRSGFVWSADDARILFSRDHNGDERQALFDLNLATAQVNALYHAPQSHGLRRGRSPGRPAAAGQQHARRADERACLRPDE